MADPVVIGEVSLSQLSGEGPEELLAGAKGQVFVSPAYDVARSGNSLDLDSLEVRVVTTDSYASPDAIGPNSYNRRPFLFGPPPAVPSTRAWPPNLDPVNYMPTPGDPIYGLAASQPQVKGVLTDVGTGVETVILY